MVYYGHSGKCRGRSDWQRLADHLRAIARRAGEFGRPLGLERAAFAAGLPHELGKDVPAFQAYIGGYGPSVDHSTAGAQVLIDQAQSTGRAMAELIAYAILGHHADLPDKLNETGGCSRRDWKDP